MIDTIYSDPNFLQHHGVKGMKWGVRRYQNKDGSLTEKGKSAYYENGKLTDKGKKAREKARQVRTRSNYYRRASSAAALIGVSAATLATSHLIGYNTARNMLHGAGNIAINSMRSTGSSKIAKNIVSGMFVAGMGAVTLSEISNVGKSVYNIGSGIAYNKSSTYKKRIDAKANMKSNK